MPLFATESPFYSKLSPEELRQCEELSNRGGSACRYPWRDTDNYKVGDSFFKPASKEDIDKDRSRPSCPKSITEETGIRWGSKSIYNRQTKQYGYLVTRIS